MSFWDSLGRFAKFLTEAPDYTPSAEAGQRIPSAAYRPDEPGKSPAQMPKAAIPKVPGAITRANITALADITKNVPDTPGNWNDSVESLRVGVINAGTNMFAPILGGLGKAADFVTLGGAGKALGAAEKVIVGDLQNIRKNYSFFRDLEANSSGMGLIGALGTVGAGLAAGAATLLAAPVVLPAAVTTGTAVGLGVLTAGAVAAAQRRAGRAGALGETVQQSAIRAEVEDTWNKYNFGNDVVKSAARIGGAVSPFGDTTPQLYNTEYGIGKISKDILNMVFEFTTSPLVGAGRVAGAGIRYARGAALEPTEKSLAGFILSKPLAGQIEAVTSVRVARDIDLLKRTAAGEDTIYTPMFDFFEKASPSLVAQRPEFRNLIGQEAANLLAGRSRQEISLVLRAGRGDMDAIDELSKKFTDTHNEIMRLEGAVTAANLGGIIRLQYAGKDMVLSKGLGSYKTNLKSVNDEIEALRKRNAWFDDAMALDSALQDRTASPFLWLERLRNDLAKERLARKLEVSRAGVKVPVLGQVFSLKKDRTPDTLGRETGLGKAIQFVYQKNAFSPLIRFFDRKTDEIPRTWINYNDPIQSPNRFRLNVRAASTQGLLTPDEATKYYNDFIGARTESDKNKVIQNYTQKIAAAVGNKYKVSALLVQTVLNEYDKQYRTLIGQTYEASLKGRGYAFGPGGVDDIIEDPQLISQLANGAILPDIAMWDKAFKKYSKKVGLDASVPLNPAFASQLLLDEFNSIWRGFTLARGGYPVNIIRDSAIRMYGDMAMFSSLKELTLDTIESLYKVDQSPQRIRFMMKNINNGAWKLNRLEKQIRLRNSRIKDTEAALKRAGYDVKKPPRKAPTDSLILQSLDSLKTLKTEYAELRRQEAVLRSKKGSVPRVKRDRMISVAGYEFNGPWTGRLGEISRRTIGNPDEIVRALGTVRELNIRTARNSRNGTSTILAVDDEAIHMAEWVQTLNEVLPFDEVAMMIMKGEPKWRTLRWLRSAEATKYLDRFGLRPSDAEEIYARVNQVVDMTAPSQALRDMVIKNEVNADNIRKLYPDPATRPPLLTDLVRDNLAQSNMYTWGRELLKDTVGWLSTRPTAALMFNPYFAGKYNQKLQTMVHVANVQGRKLTKEDLPKFEAIARQYAIKEYREKLNSFHRDMNYGGMINYVLAFFPAVIEQYRAYGRIILDNPDFIVKAGQISVIPQEYMNAQENSFGDQYVEVDLPLIGPTDVKHRLPASWFNPLNPTGGSSIISVGPVGAFATNYLGKKFLWDNAVTNWILPFGARDEASTFLTPNTIKRVTELFKAQVQKSGQQFNKDTAMLLRYKQTEFFKEFDRQPTAKEMIALNEEAMDDAVAMAWGRFVNAVALPIQPQYVSPLQVYTDELYKMREADPINGEEKFMQKYPDYFLLASSLTDPTSGVVPDVTSAALIKKNPNVVKGIVGEIDLDNLTVLGAVFNDENYAFSSSAQAWLQEQTIPNTNRKYREYGDAFQVQRSATVNKGWNDYTKFKEIVTQAIAEEKLSPTSGYGKVRYDKYMDAFIEKTKTVNPMWHKEWETQSGAGSERRRLDLITALTMAANDDNLWADLQKQQRWHSIVNYLNFRYDIYDELKRRNTTYDSSKAKDLRKKVDQFVYNLRITDIQFGKFYDRYLDRDKFDVVYEGQG